ncbi:MAG TPA: PQQ-dependent dehydrogenase, methanol/ethanol family [Steroidobacteraceae bacterium]|nr:PQQ-dependent dehydrogenase, methanol/ethanol family [Steroidobacteraceae bacterium]
MGYERLESRLAAAVGIILLGALGACSKQGNEPAANAASTVVGKADVDGARIANADSEPGSWMSHGRTYSEQRYSPLTQITKDNVGKLGLAWFADMDTNRGQEATPIVVDGVIYVSTAWSKVKAYEAKTGKPLWNFDPEVPGQFGVNACCDVVNRGVAVWKGKVFVGTIDGRLIALDSATGKKLWDVVTVDQTKPYTITGAPRVIKGKVLIGNGGAELGVRGYITAYDPDSGKQIWRFYTVPGNPKDGPDNAPSDAAFAKVAGSTWFGEYWKMGGGGTVWDSMSYDPGLDLLYIGVGNGSPWNRALRSNGKGDNLFLSSIVALKPDTGEYVWHYQSTNGESWDHTATQQIIIADLTIDGAKRHVLMQAPKNGFFYVIDAATGQLISAKNFTDVAWATGVDLKTGRPIETKEARYEVTGKPFLSKQNPNGAHTWHSMAFSPQTGLVYLPIHGTPFMYAAPKSFGPRPLTQNVGADFSGNAALDPKKVLDETYGRLIAWDPVNQKEVWRVERAGQANGGALATAGGLVFQGTGSGQFTALDATNGKELWSAPVQTGIVAAPITYSIDGEQYVAIMAGSGSSWALIGGDTNMKGFLQRNISRLLVYKLGGTVQLPPAPEVQPLPMNPPPATAAADVVAKGGDLYGAYCSSCHGPAAIQVGILPDLRRTPYLQTEETFASVVLGGERQAHGMANFSSVLKPADVQAIRAFVVLRSNQDKPAAAGAAPAR